MANVRNSNTIYIDATGTIAATANAKVTQVIFTSSASGDTMTLRDGSSGSNKITVRNNLATDTKQLDFSQGPIVFPNGIHIQVLSASCTAMLVTRQGE